MQQRSGERYSARKKFEMYLLFMCVILVVNMFFLMKVQSQLKNMNKALNQVMATLATARRDSEEGMIVASQEEVISPQYQSAPQKPSEPAASGRSEEVDYVELCGLPQVDKPVDRKLPQVLSRLEELAEDSNVIKNIWQDYTRYPEEMLGALANNPEMADFVSNYLTSDAKPSGVGLTKAEKNSNFRCFCSGIPDGVMRNTAMTAMWDCPAAVLPACPWCFIIFWETRALPRMLSPITVWKTVIICRGQALHGSCWRMWQIRTV